MTKWLNWTKLVSNNFVEKLNIFMIHFPWVTIFSFLIFGDMPLILNALKFHNNMFICISFSHSLCQHWTGSSNIHNWDISFPKNLCLHWFSFHLYNPLPQCHTLFDEPVIRICNLSELLTSTPHSFYNHQLLCFWFTCSITPTTSWRVIKMCDLLNLLISHYVSLFFLFLSA